MPLFPPSINITMLTNVLKKDGAPNFNNWQHWYVWDIIFQKYRPKMPKIEQFSKSFTKIGFMGSETVSFKYSPKRLFAHKDIAKIVGTFWAAQVYEWIKRLKISKMSRYISKRVKWQKFFCSVSALLHAFSTSTT